MKFNYFYIPENFLKLCFYLVYLAGITLTYHKMLILISLGIIECIIVFSIIVAAIEVKKKYN